MHSPPQSYGTPGALAQVWEIENLLRDLRDARDDLRAELREFRDAREAMQTEVEETTALARALRRANDERLQDEAEGWPWPQA